MVQGDERRGRDSLKSRTNEIERMGRERGAIQILEGKPSLMEIEKKTSGRRGDGEMTRLGTNAT